jgi:hypothetical protein
MIRQVPCRKGFCLTSVSGVFLLAGCANLEVTKIPSDRNALVKPEGVRYCLPKPFLQATPQLDGTVAFDVIYLPDSDHCYAIKTSTDWSNYTFQVSRDEKGLLTAIEFKASTTVVGQQLLTSAGAAAVQDYNVRAAQQAAVQTAVNAAAGAVDTAKANFLAAQAALDSDKAHGAKDLTSDYSNIAQYEAKLRSAEQALQRVQQTGQATSTAVAPSPVATTTSPAMGTIFGQPTWPAVPSASNLPEKFGPVLFAINDSINGGKEVVELKAVAQSPMEVLGSLTVDPAELQRGVVAGFQGAFETVATALGPPSVSPIVQSVQKAKTAKVAWTFSRPIVTGGNLMVTVTSDPGGQVQTVKTELGADAETVSMDVSNLGEGDYSVEFKFKYEIASGQTMPSATAKTKLTITAPPKQP